MYKHILVAVDDSPTSTRTIGEAVALAKGSNAELTIVHAVDEALFSHFTRTTLGSRDAVQSALIKEGQAVLDGAVAIAQAAGATPKAQLLTSEHLSTSEQIVHAVKDLHADLLVVGSHGRRGVQRIFLGSVAERLLRKVTISAMIVRGIDA
ncbi:MAG: universal stress protein [Rhodocyclaceae bacterium]|nr:universal stress protein [Rhodocyclaceae bacterium]